MLVMTPPRTPFRILTSMPARRVARKRRVSPFSMIIAAGLVLLTTILPAPVLAGSALPQGFVYLRDIDSTIVQDIRYAGSHNFVGRPIRGYLAAECILSSAAANALETVQRMLAEKKLSLIVWDCYRPKRAVEDFLQWCRDPVRQGKAVRSGISRKTIGSLAGEHGGPRYRHDRFFIRAAACSLAVPQGVHVSKRRKIRGWNYRFRNGLRLFGRACKYIKPSCGPHSTA
jgi:hypothetical protein